MSIESNQTNHPNPLAANSPVSSGTEQSTPNAATTEADQKVKAAIPEEIAHPQEHPPGPMPPVDFQAKMINQGSEGTVPAGIVDEALLNHESVENGQLPNLTADVMAHSIQSGQPAAKLSAEEEMLANLNLDELSPEELERMLADMEKQETSIAQQKEAETSEFSADEKVLTQTETNIATESQVVHQATEDLQTNAQLAKATDAELTSAQEQHSTMAAQISSTAEEVALPPGSSSDDIAAHKAAYEQKIAKIDEHINKLESAIKADPNNTAMRAQLDALRAAKNELQEKVASGMSHEEAMKTTFISGMSLHQMSVNDLHEILQSFHSASEGHEKEIGDDASKTGERNRADRSARDEKSSREKAEAGKKEELLRSLESQGRIETELQYQQMRSRIEKDKEKLEESLQKILTSVREDRMMKEIEKSETKKDAASDTIVSKENKQKAINSTQKLIDEVGTPLKMPVKKETLRMVVSVIRQIDSIPAGKSDPQIRDLQKTLIGFYQDIRPAVGVEVLGGAGAAHRIHTNQSS